MKRKEVTEPIYGSHVLILVGGTQEKAHESAKAWFLSKGSVLDNYDGKNSAARTWTDDSGCYAVWLGKADGQTAAHEAVHVGVLVMAWIGHEIKPATDEPLAYYVDWLVGEIAA